MPEQKPIWLTQLQARKIILHATGLSRRAQFGRGKEAVYKLVDHLGFLQVDTNYIVERAHHHAIAARIPDYRTEWLEELQSEGRIFEFWTYASGFIPMHEFRFSLPVKASFLARRKPLSPAEENMMRKVLDRISREGPRMASDFEYDREKKSSGWWDWRPSKVALERLHFEGRLATTRTKDFFKLYDLSENVIPSGVDTSMPTEEEYARYTIRRALQALGVAYQKDISWRGRYVKNSIKEELQKMVCEGEVCEVIVPPLKGPLYMLPAYRKRKVEPSKEAFILSPFDALNVYRHRLRDFFNFDYQVECFVPAPKRKYGYFALPVLIGDTFVARMDCKAERKQRLLLINNLHFEKIKLTKSMISKLAEAIQAFASFNQCDHVIVKKTNSRSLSRDIMALIE